MPKHCVNLFSEAGEALARDVSRIPWEAYPRPHMERDSYFSLNGWWRLSVRPRRGEPFSCKIRVPFPPQAPLSGVEREVPQDATLCYECDFTFADLPKNGDRILLHVDAADHASLLTLNGARIGGHAGGYSAICVDVTPYLQEKNRLRITVMDDDRGIFPYGKQRKKRGGMWYTPVSGIWQSVWMERVPEAYIGELCVESDTEGATLSVEGENTPLSGTVTLHLKDKELQFPLEGGKARITPPDPHLWTPETPYLYHVTVTAGEDVVRSYFALRRIEISEHGGRKRLFLNGNPYFFHGLLDQGYFSDGLFLPATPEGYSKDILLAKHLGFNTLRKHIKVEPERFYFECDRLGMIVMQDMVNNGHYSFLRDTALPTIGCKRRNDRRMHRNETARAAFLATMEQTVRRLSFHPSVLYWTIFNEGWGQFDHAAVYEKLRALDSTRVIDSVSGWFLPPRGDAQSDVESPHVYFKPVKLHMGARPMMLSEFGGYSHRVEGHCFNLKRNYGYRVFKTKESLAEALKTLYEGEILPCVRAGLSGAIYTQLSDVEDETNGLVTYDRRVCKVEAEVMQEIASKLRLACEEVTDEE